MFIVKDGYYYVGITLAIAVVTFFTLGASMAVIPLVLALYFAYFFRDFHRITPPDENILYAPADGTVMKVEEIYEDEYLFTECKKVTIFLSVFNVHTNRAPLGGEIKYQRYTVGGFIPADDRRATFMNERHAIGVDNGEFQYMVIQVAGLLARRIVSWVTLGHRLEQGETYGMIKFGSSTELIVPKSVEICVKKGQSVTGGITVIGRIKA
ncbi:MAG: phosphatidylserine decarboxylase [Phascolarctobacterium sp.]|nr:phosphatidylserine decarboxylase [Phascolarctobacterium sp.]